MTWTSEALRSGAATVYDVMRGQLRQFPVGTGSGETCAIQGTPFTSLSPDAAPTPGTGFYYDARGRNTCGAGTYGFSSDGIERVTTACP